MCAYEGAAGCRSCYKRRLQACLLQQLLEPNMRGVHGEAVQRWVAQRRGKKTQNQVVICGAAHQDRMTCMNLSGHTSSQASRRATGRAPASCACSNCSRRKRAKERRQQASALRGAPREARSASFSASCRGHVRHQCVADPRRQIAFRGGQSWVQDQRGSLVGGAEQALCVAASVLAPHPRQVRRIHCK